jgi:hypothetical protein
MEITPHIRQLVMELECERLGHQIDPYVSVRGSDGGMRALGPGSTDKLKLPHMSCERCGYTWITLPVGGPDYDSAERVLWNQLDKTTKFAKQVLRDRSRRAERDRQPRPESPDEDEE